MISKIFKTICLLAFFFITIVVVVVTRPPLTTFAAQCWENGCCGFTLRYNQFQCQSVGSGGNLCYEMGEEPHWFCPNTPLTFGTQQACQNNCSETCGKACWSGWGSTCVHNQHDQPCLHPNANTCYASYAAILCQSLQGVNACEEAIGTTEDRQCWVNIPGPSPTPGVTPPPPPGDCTGNWYGCTGPTWCSNFNTQADCAANASQCACGSCACQTERGKVAFTFFEDTNQNGVWDYNAGERRIHPNSSCDTSNTMVVNGVQIWFENNQLSPNCNIGDSEFSGNTCTWGPDECYRDGVLTGTCHPWGWESQDWGDKCFTEPKTCSRCHWDNQGCEPTDAVTGMVCASNPAYCSGSNANLRNGYVYVREAEVGVKNVQVVVPTGWMVSPGNYGGGTQFTVNITNSFSRTRCEAGLKTIGLVPNYNKQCTISLTQNSIPANQSTLATVWANSGMPGSEPARLVLGKADYTQILDENNQPYIPPGTNHVVSSGRHFYIWNSALSVVNGSFETGNTTGWTRSATINPSEFWVVDSLQYPSPGLDGRYYLKIARESAGDAYAVSDWIDVGRNVAGESFILNFKARSHTTSHTISNISLQREGDFVQAFIGDININNTAWTTFNRTVTFPNTGTSTRIRVVLRVPTSNWPIYYDGISVQNADGSGGCSTGNGTACQSSTTVSGLPVGNYKLHCDLPTNPQRCSGNPNCTYEGGSVVCTGWQSCSNQDNVNLAVTCAPQCGQGGGCGTGDLGTPNPTNLQPTTRNMTTNPGTPVGTVPITWSESNIVTDYWTLVLYSGTQKTATELDAIATNCAANNGSNGVLCTSLNYAAFDTNHDGILDLTPTYNYDSNILRQNNLRLAIRGVNNTCAPYNGGNSQNSTWRHSTLSLTANVTGNIYAGDGNPTSGICTGPTTPVSFPATTNRTLSAASGGTPHTTPNSSAFSILNVPYVPNINWGAGTQISLTLNNTDMSQAWACECPSPVTQGNPYLCRYSNILTPSTGPAVNFWVQEYNLVNGPWWQTWGGMVYGATGTVLSDIPQTCIDDNSGYCRSFMVARDRNNTNYSGSIAMSGSGQISSGDVTGYVTDRTPFNQEQKAQGTYHNGVTHENYDFLVREIVVSNYTSTVPPTVTTSNHIFNTHFTTMDDDTRIYYAPVSVTINPTETIQLPSGVTKAVVLINGSLTIRDNANLGEVVNVNDGHFLAFVANGNITIEPSVGFTKTMTNQVPVTSVTNLEGVYVADETLIIQGYDSLSQPQLIDRKFIGAGTFVGLAGVQLDRDFQNSVDPLTRSINNLDPVSTFVYRPDFVTNLPRFMHNPGLVWQEVN